MLTYREHHDTEIFEITVNGFVKRDDYDEIVAALERFIDRHGKARLLQVVKDFGGMEIGAFWADLNLALHHMRDFTRCAVVTDKTWIEWFTKAAAMMTDCEIKCYRLDERDKAMAWLSEHVHKAPEGLA